MIIQKDIKSVSEYWDTTGEWRLNYFENLKKTPDEKLNSVLRAEKEFALTEESVLKSLLSESKSVLELGCGVGRSIINEIANNPEVSFVGIDLSPCQIKLFQEQINSRNLKNARAYVSNVDGMNWLDEKFDLIMMCNHTFGNFLGETREKCLNEMCRLLHGNGKIMVGGFTNISIAEQCYKEWNIEIEHIGYESGFFQLKNYNSYWQKQDETNNEFLNHGFYCVNSVENTLGFVNTYGKQK